MSETLYTPSPEEIARAEKMMSEEERIASSHRETEHAKKHAEGFAQSTEEARRKEKMPLRIAKALFERRESSKQNLITPEEVESFYYDKEKEASLVYFDEETKKQLETFPMSVEELMADNPWGLKDEEGNLLPTIDCIVAYPGGFRMGDTDESPTYFDLKEKLDPKLIRYEAGYLDKDKARQETLGTGWVIMVKEALFRDENWYEQLASLSHAPEPEVRKRYANLLGLPETSDAATLAQEFYSRFPNEKDKLSQGDAEIQSELFKDASYEPASPLQELVKEEFYHKKTKERLNPDVWARTNTLAADGGRVSVGGFKSDGLHVDSAWDDSADSPIGLSVSRKFKK